MYVLCILDYVSDVMAKFVFVLHIFKDMMKVHFLSPLTEKKNFDSPVQTYHFIENVYFKNKAIKTKYLFWI